MPATLAPPREPTTAEPERPSPPESPRPQADATAAPPRPKPSAWLPGVAGEEPAGRATLRALEEDIETAEWQFRRRFRDALEPGIKAEFIGGRVVVHSPAKLEHNGATWNLANLIGNLARVRGLGLVQCEKALVELQREDVDPDVCFWFTAKSELFERGQMVFPPPDLVAEVLSPSTEVRDRTEKFHAYERSGVGEYWMLDPRAWQVEPFALREGRYAALPVVDGRGDAEIASVTLPEFRVPAKALFDPAANLAALRAILAG